MQIDYALILAAGFGTRMGPIGKILPKVIWPVFEQSILEVQLRYAHKIGCKKVFINLHHASSTIYNMYSKHPLFKDVHWLFEDPILDIGGAIHNVATQDSVNYKGNLLVLNSDLLSWIPEQSLNTALNCINKFETILFTQSVNTSDGYNALDLTTDNVLKGIILNKNLSRDKMVQTYSGVSLINLSKINPRRSVSKFFESVAIPENNGSYCLLINEVDYWDFGTLKRYWNSSFQLMNTKNNFIDDLIDWRVIDPKKINTKNNSYSSNSVSVINLTPWISANEMSHAIILKVIEGLNNEKLVTQVPKIIYNDLISDIIEA